MPGWNISKVSLLFREEAIECAPIVGARLGPDWVIKSHCAKLETVRCALNSCRSWTGSSGPRPFSNPGLIGA
jgi:hypothetical protein